MSGISVDLPFDLDNDGDDSVGVNVSDDDITHLGNQILNFVLNMGTAGTVGWDEGKFQEGPTLDLMRANGIDPRDAAANIYSLGLVGYEDGEFKPGVITRGVTEGVGHLTGANAMRDMLQAQQDYIREEKARLKKEAQDRLYRQEGLDRQASNTAASGTLRRRASVGNKTSSLTGTGDELNSSSLDYLGLS